MDVCVGECMLVFVGGCVLLGVCQCVCVCVCVCVLSVTLSPEHGSQTDRAQTEPSIHTHTHTHSPVIRMSPTPHPDHPSPDHSNLINTSPASGEACGSVRTITPEIDFCHKATGRNEAALPRWTSHTQQKQISFPHCHLSSFDGY